MIGTTEHYPAALQDSSGQSGVSWAAIFAGAATAAVLSLLLLMSPPAPEDRATPTRRSGR